MSMGNDHIRWEGLVQNQVRLWKEREEQEPKTAENEKSAWDKAHITISRAYGARGYRIGELIAKTLHWKVYSRKLVEHISDTANLREQIIKEFDEKKHNVSISQIIFDPQAFSSDKYYRHLLQVILAIVQHGQAVIVGRGANFVATSEPGLHVRVTASFESRVHRYANKQKVPYKEARKKVESVDRERAHYIKYYFHKDIEDPHFYDLVINVEHYSNEQVAEMIIHALEVKLNAKRPAHAGEPSFVA